MILAVSDHDLPLHFRQRRPESPPNVLILLDPGLRISGDTVEDEPNFVQTIQRVFTQSRISAQLHYCLNVYGTKPRATETDSLDTRQYCRRLSNKSAERVTPPLWWRQLKKAVQPVTLQDVASAILERERTKLGPLNFEDSEVSKRLYLPNEQLGHLAAKVYGNPAPEMPHMSPLDAQTYENALKTWVDDHPFLDGRDRPSSAVFDAMIATWTLRHSKSDHAKDTAVERELARGIAANPILSEIYMNELFRGDELYIPPEHVGIVYSSLRARLSLGDAASMLIEDTETSVDDDELRAEVEITHLRRNDQRARVVELKTDREGLVRLGTHVEDVEVVAPDSCVEFGSGDEAVLVAPISIQCGLLSIESKKLIAEPSPSSSMGTVYLEAREFTGYKMTSVPVLRGKGTLANVCWPVTAHPVFASV